MSLPPVSAAGVNHISGFTPSGPITAGKPVEKVVHDRAAGRPAAHPVRHRAGPHTGVHLIFVREDLANIVHLHPPIGPDGKISETVAFPGTLPAPWMLC